MIKKYLFHLNFNFETALTLDSIDLVFFKKNTHFHKI